MIKLCHADMPTFEATVDVLPRAGIHLCVAKKASYMHCESEMKMKSPPLGVKGLAGLRVCLCGFYGAATYPRYVPCLCPFPLQVSDHAPHMAALHLTIPVRCIPFRWIRWINGGWG